MEPPTFGEVPALFGEPSDGPANDTALDGEFPMKEWFPVVVTLIDDDDETRGALGGGELVFAGAPSTSRGLASGAASTIALATCMNAQLLVDKQDKTK